MYPDDRLYTKSHEWLKQENGIVIVGITEFAQSELTDIVFVELPQVGRNITKGDAVAVVESVKTAADIYSPVSGEIVEVNSNLESKPELINESPYDEGWIFKVKIGESFNKDEFLTSAEYEKLLSEGE